MKRIIKTLVGIFALLLLTQCKHKAEELEIENGYIPVNANFNVVTPFSISKNYVDFSNDTVRFSAKFNQAVSWTIEVKGDSSGATMKFDGVSDEIKPSEVFWNGVSNTITFFDQGETYKATLSFLGSDQPEVILDSIQQVRSFEGVLVSDFEKWSSPMVSNSSFWSFSDANEAYVTGIKSDVVVPVQGSSYYSLGGEDKNSNYYVAGLGHNGTLFGLDGTLDENYFNIFLNSNEQITTQVEIVMGEVDGDKWALPVNIDWKGWQQKSFKLSEFSYSPTYSTGDGKFDASKVWMVEFSLLTGDTPGPGAKKEVHMDYLVFTKGHPFSQSN